MKKGMAAILTGITGTVAGALITGRIKDKEVKQSKEKTDKFKTYYYMANHWLAMEQENKSLAAYFTKNNYKTIAVYGMGEMGNRLYDELKDTDIRIKYAIDQNADQTCSELRVITLEEELEEVDAVIVTAVFAFEEIEKKLSGLFSCPVISLEDVIYEF